MKRSLSLLLLAPAFVAPAVVVATTAPAQAGQSCTQLWKSANATQYTCTSTVNTFQFRTYVVCKRPGLPNFSYTEYGPLRNSGGTSAAYCDRQSSDFRVDDGTAGIA